MKSAFMFAFSLFFVTALADAKTPAELVQSGTPEEKGTAIAQELDSRNAGYKDLGGTVEMVLRDGGGGEAKRQFTLKLLERPNPGAGDYSLITFDSPADVKGTALLSHAKIEGEDDQWLYLPSTKRVKRVASSNRTGAFAGSEFSFEDLTGNESRKYAWKLAGTEPCGDAECFKLEATPKDSSSSYSKRVLRVDTTELRILSTELFDRAGTRVKTLTYAGYRKLKDRFWRAASWTMKNHQSGKSTVLTFTQLSLDNGYTANDFSSGKLGDSR